MHSRCGEAILGPSSHDLAANSIEEACNEIERLNTIVAAMEGAAVRHSISLLHSFGISGEETEKFINEDH